jgi:hypothetical protein
MKTLLEITFFVKHTKNTKNKQPFPKRTCSYLMNQPKQATVMESLSRVCSIRTIKLSSGFSVKFLETLALHSLINFIGSLILLDWNPLWLVNQFLYQPNGFIKMGG